MINFIPKLKAAGKAKDRVGLDIGSQTIKVVEISSLEGKATLVGYGLKDIHNVASPALADSIKSVMREANISIKDVNISVSGPSVIVRFISMPKMSDADLKGAVRFEAEKFIPFNMNDCVIDFQTLKRDKGENRLDLLLVAVKKDLVWERVKLAESAGLSVSIVDVDSFAMTNSFFTNFPAIEKDKTVALLNFGAKSTNLSIINNGIISFMRDVAIGSNDFNASIIKVLAVSEDAAEALKISPKDRASEISSIIKGVMNSLFDDIKLSFGYHENQSGKGIDDVYICGGGAAIIGLEAFFQETFGSKPVFWNPIQFLNTASSAIEPGLLDKAKSSLAVAVGLALR